MGDNISASIKEISKVKQVYDMTNRETYQHLMNWLADARTLARADISIIAVGNKCDMKDRRAVTCTFTFYALILCLSVSLFLLFNSYLNLI